MRRVTLARLFRLSPARLGRIGEHVAARYLESRDYSILATNVRARSGEIDIIAREGTELVLVEVKTAYRVQAFQPFDKIDSKKASRIEAIGEQYQRDQGSRLRGLKIFCRRFDSIMVRPLLHLGCYGRFEITHRQNEEISRHRDH